MARRAKSGYINGVRKVHFPGMKKGEYVHFHKPGTKAYKKGRAAKRRNGERLAREYGF